MYKRRFSWLILIILLNSSVINAQENRPLGLAVLDLQANGISEVEAIALSDMLRSGIVKTLKETSNINNNYQLIERSQMDKIFEQFEIQNTGCTDLSCAVEFGRLLNTDHIIIGSVSLVGSTYMVVARIVDVETGRTITSVDRKQQGVIDNVIDLMPIVGHELLTGERLAAPVPSIPLPEVQPQRQSLLNPQISELQLQYLSVLGSPEGATVILNNVKIGESPIDYQMVNPGRYSVKISKEGYIDHEVAIVVSPGADEKIAYDLIQRATLNVTGNLENAIVMLNGEEIGTTPLISYYLESGQYFLSISHDGHLDFEDDFTVYDDHDRTITYELTSISIEGFPDGAHVFIDNKQVGQAPINDYTIIKGQHTVKVSQLGFNGYSEAIVTGQDGPASINYFLMPKTKQGVIVRSLLFPGAGQFYAGYTSRGVLISLLQVVTIGGVVCTTLSATKSWKDYDDAESLYKNAVLGADYDGLYQKLESKHNDALSAYNLQMAAAGVVAVVYLYNVIDAFLTSPRVEVNPTTFERLNWQPNFGRGYTGIAAEVYF